MNIDGYICVIVPSGNGYEASVPQLPGLRARGIDREACEAAAEAMIHDFVFENDGYIDNYLRSLEASGVPQSRLMQLLDQIETLLGADEQSVYNCRLKPFSADELPADLILPTEADADYTDNASTDRVAKFRILHFAQGITETSDSNSAMKVADARYVRAAQLLTADPTLGGTTLYCRELSSKWVMEERSRDSVIFEVTWEIEFSTKRTDPSQAGF